MGESIKNIAAAFLKSESGATAIEYGMLVAMISIIGVFVLQGYGNAFIAILGTASTTINTASAAAG